MTKILKTLSCGAVFFCLPVTLALAQSKVLEPWIGTWTVTMNAYTAGRLAHALIPQGERRKVDLNDAATAALELIKRYGDKWKRAVTASAAAQDLAKKGYKDDVIAATQADCYDLVPEYAERQVTLPARQQG